MSTSLQRDLVMAERAYSAPFTHTEPIVACVFPFTFNDVTYNECTDVSNDSTEWCALESDYAWVDASNPGLWGNCVCADPGAGR